MNVHCWGNYPCDEKVGIFSHLPISKEKRVPSLGGEDPPEEEVATTPVFLPGKFPWTEEPGGLQSMGS